ncbi:MAG: hypothetical protein LUQ38_05270 [Methanotrichaceae archaeon]|nr:hypothetical protein [Methanotrichaceae archaeon]
MKAGSAFYLSDVDLMDPKSIKGKSTLLLKIWMEEQILAEAGCHNSCRKGDPEADHEFSPIERPTNIASFMACSLKWQNSFMSHHPLASEIVI